MFGENIKESDKKLIIAEALEEMALTLEQFTVSSEDVTRREFELYLKMQAAFLARSKEIKQEAMSLKGKYR